MKTTLKTLAFDWLLSQGDLNPLCNQAIEYAKKKDRELSKTLDIPQTWEILETICEHYLIPEKKIIDQDKREPIRTVRMIFVYVCHLAGYSSENIAITIKRSRNAIDNTTNRVGELIDENEPCYDKKLHANIIKMQEIVLG